MSTFGSSPSWSFWNWYGSGVQNQACTGLTTVPANAWCTSVSVFVDGHGASITGHGCIWNSGGSLIANGSGFSAGSGGASIGGQHWHTDSLSGIFLSSGTQVYIGWTRPTGQSMEFSTNSGGTGYIASGGNPGSLGSRSAPGFGHAIGAYVTYTPVFAPLVTTDAATSVGTTTATLNGHVDPQGLQSTWDFQWGTTNSYGNTTTGGSVGSGGSFPGSTPESNSLTLLTPGVIYHYRIVASNAAGTTYGADQQFTTNGIPNAPTLTAPTNNAYQSIWQAGATFSWTYNWGGGGLGSTETAYALKITPAGGSPQWWTGSAWAAIETWVTTASTSVTIAAGNFTSTVASYAWTVASQDANGNGPYASAFTLNNEIAPAAPSLGSPANATYAELAGTPTFSWTYNPTNGQGGQTNYAFRRKISGASAYSYWNAGSSAWQTTPIVWNALTTQSLTFPSAAWADGNTYNWSVANQDVGGQGPFAADWTVTGEVAPTVTVTAPTGTESSFRPVVAWSATFPTGLSETAYQVRTFTAAQYGAGGFNPATSAAADDSGVVASGSGLSYQVATTLTNGTAYRSYVNVSETGGVTNGFNAFTGFIAAADTPNAPTITATATTDPATGCPMIQLQVQSEVNLVSAVDSSFESGIGTFSPNNCTLAQSATHFLDGAFSLRLTASSAATMTASTGYYPVSPSTLYTLVGSFWASTTSRGVEVQFNWFDATHTSISALSSTGFSDSNAAWTQAVVTATSPVNAAFVIISVNVISPANGEIHYLDNVGVFPGTTTIWSLGGFLSTAGVAILRSDGVYVRNASIANPALLSNFPASQLVTVNDYEATPLTAYMYTAQVQAIGAIGVVISPPSSPAGASLSTTQWWELDPTTPSTAVSAQPIAWNPQQYEQGAAHTVLGQQTQIYVSSVMQGADVTATMETFTVSTHQGLLALATGQKTVLFSSPFGESYYLRIAPAPGGMSMGMGSKAHDTQLLPSTAAGPHRLLAITGIAAARPPV